MRSHKPVCQHTAVVNLFEKWPLSTFCLFLIGLILGCGAILTRCHLSGHGWQSKCLSRTKILALCSLTEDLAFVTCFVFSPEGRRHGIQVSKKHCQNKVKQSTENLFRDRARAPWPMPVTVNTIISPLIRSPFCLNYSTMNFDFCHQCFQHAYNNMEET